MKLEKALRAGAHIHFHDNGGWIVYASEPKEGRKEPKVLCEGDDACDSDGYLPHLVSALADKLGMTSDSI